MIGTIDLLEAILRGTPPLPNAACRGRHRLFDPAAQGEQLEATADRHAQALAICASCAELARCREFYGRLPPSRRPLGVIAGTVNRPSPRRRKRSA